MIIFLFAQVKWNEYYRRVMREKGVVFELVFYLNYV